MNRFAVFLLAAAVMLGAASVRGQQAGPLFLDAEVVNTFPHDSTAFTQGLIMLDGSLYEGTGRNGESVLREVELETGEVIRQTRLDEQYFGEGLTYMDGRFYQLTWRAHTGFIYDRDFNLTGSFLYSGEGWGLTHDGENLIMSDGTATLRFLDPGSFRVARRLEVTFQGQPLVNLNELEYIDGEIWANVWYQDALVRIDPETGVVNSVVDLSSLYPEHPRDNVLNGIAWDEDAQRLFVTGKLWPTVFEIRVREPGT